MVIYENSTVNLKNGEVNYKYESVNYENNTVNYKYNTVNLVNRRVNYKHNTVNLENSIEDIEISPCTSPSTFANRTKASLPPVFVKARVLFPLHGLQHSFVHKGSYPLIPYFLGEARTCIYVNEKFSK